MENALKLIISKSPLAASEAIQTLRAISAKSPILQLRYNRTVELALSDPDADFTQAERSELAEHINLSESASRDFMLRVRLTDAERVALQDAAAASDLSMSEYARRKIFG